MHQSRQHKTTSKKIHTFEEKFNNKRPIFIFITIRFISLQKISNRICTYTHNYVNGRLKRLLLVAEFICIATSDMYPIQLQYCSRVAHVGYKSSSFVGRNQIHKMTEVKGP